MAPDGLLRKAGMERDAGFLPEGVRAPARALMEAEVAERVGAGRHERAPERVGQRNGYRERVRDTRVGTVDPRVPRVRDGGFCRALREPRRRAERALAAVVQEADVAAVSTRRVDDPVKALGIEGVSKNEVGRLCGELDPEVERFRSRPRTAAYPYPWLDATFAKVRQHGRDGGQAVVVAVAVTADGTREGFGVDVGPSEDGAC